MHPADIIAALKKHNSSLTRIANARGVTATTVSHVVHSRGSSLPTAIAIAKATGLPLDTLWPGRYTKSLREKSNA